MPNRRLAALGLSVLLAGCALGDRPKLESPGQAASTTVARGSPSGAPGADKILAALEQSADQSTFTAKYHLTRKLGDVERDAVVVHRPGATAVTIGDWTFIRDGQDRTCQTSTGKCVPGILLQRVSDVINTDNFWASTAAIQIRLGLGQRSADPTFSSEPVAGQNSDCVSIPLGGGVEKYCVGPTGIETLTNRNDLAVRLTALSPTIDEKVFRRG